MSKKTVLLPDGRPLFLSIEDFKRGITTRDHCFLCMRDLASSGRSKEHVIPKWILRKFDLFDQSVTIGDGTRIPYRKHVVPCCPDCNALLGSEIEQPVRELLLADHSDIDKRLRDPRISQKVICWLALLHFKSLYKDSFVIRFHEKERRSYRLSDETDWFIHHHVNCLCRLVYPEVSIQPNAIGSLAFFFLETNDPESFDFCSLHSHCSLMVRVGRLAIVSVLNDSGGALNIFNDNFENKLPKRGKDIMDIREYLGHLSLVNSHLEDRPQYYSEINREGRSVEICASLPSKGARCLFDPSNSDHWEERIQVWDTVFGSYKSAMNPMEKKYLANGTLAFLERLSINQN